MRKNHLQLSPAERAHLQGRTRQHTASVTVFKRATALLAARPGRELAASGGAGRGQLQLGGGMA